MPELKRSTDAWLHTVSVTSFLYTFKAWSVVAIDSINVAKAVIAETGFVLIHSLLNKPTTDIRFKRGGGPKNALKLVRC